jgi:hypothetical protein
LESFTFDHSIATSYTLALQDDRDAGPVDLKLLTQFVDGDTGSVGLDQFINFSFQEAAVNLLLGFGDWSRRP